MIYQNYLRASVAVGAMFAASTASAQLSADAVWDSWIAYYETFDQTVDIGSRARAGNVLTLGAVRIATDVPDGGSISMMIDQVVLTEQSDGSVTIVMSETIPMRFEFPEMSEGDAFVVTIAQPQFRTVASEVEDGIRYDYEGPEVSIVLTELVAEGAPIDATLDIRMTKLAGFYEIYTDEIGGIESDLSVGNMTVNLDFINPDNSNEAFDLKLAVRGMSFAFGGEGFDLFDGENLPEALAAGFAFGISSASEAIDFSVNFRDRRENFSATIVATDTATDFFVDPERVSYGTTSSNAAISFSGADIPLPSVELGYSEFTIGASVPLSPEDPDQDVVTELRLVDLTISDDVWALADPIGAFPRGPATLILDLVGKVNLADAVYSDQAMMMMMMAGPLALGELTEITLNELQVNALGIQLSADAEFTLDYSDLETFDGFPRPVGMLSMALKGGNAMLDTLTNMGILSSQDVLGARMTLGMLARPVPNEDDSLTSTLELREDGSIYANGQRIQ